MQKLLVLAFLLFASNESFNNCLVARENNNYQSGAAIPDNSTLISLKNRDNICAEWEEKFGKLKINLAISTRQFNKEKHFLNTWEISVGVDSLVEIDQHPAHGCFEESPITEISSLALKINNKAVNIPRDSYSNLYNPVLERAAAYFNKDISRIYLSLPLSDGTDSNLTVFEFSYKELNDRKVYSNNDTISFIDEIRPSFDSFNDYIDPDSIIIEMLLDQYVNKGNKENKITTIDLIRLDKRIDDDNEGYVLMKRKYRGIDIKFEAQVQKFDRYKHVYNNGLKYEDIEHLDPNNIYLDLIDGHALYGSWSHIPDVEYKSISITINGKKYPIPKRYYEDLYELHSWLPVDIYCTEDGEYIFYAAKGADGGETYQAMFIFNKEQFLDRINYSFVGDIIESLNDKCRRYGAINYFSKEKMKKIGELFGKYIDKNAITEAFTSFPTELYYKRCVYELSLYTDSLLTIKYSDKTTGIENITVQFGKTVIQFPQESFSDLRDLDLHDEDIIHYGNNKFILAFTSINEEAPEKNYSAYLLFDKNGYIDRKIQK